MSLIDIDTAIIRMYEDTALTDSLDDETAQILLRWGEGQLRLWANRSQTPEDFESKFDLLRKIMKLVNRFSGGRARMSDEKRTKYLTVLVERANEIGYPASQQVIGTILAAQSQLDDTTVVRMLLAMLETGSTHTAPLPDNRIGDFPMTEENPDDPPKDNPRHGLDLRDIPGLDLK
ncbi:MAG: hypothetical protein CUN56_08690 [Phototrophicales bacterium]|nr:MAG: hypothetical protein CUN56_08690 [Phototrophicales bacterium]